MARSKLTEEQRAHVVKRLACHDTLLSIVRDLKSKFGITVSPAGVAHYDPERTADALIAQRWKDLFWKTRKAYIARTADIGFTDKPARIRRREAMMHREWAAGRHKLANAILDSIAKDIGDAFGRKRKHAHDRSSGAPLSAIGNPSQHRPARKAGARVRKPRD